MLVRVLKKDALLIAAGTMVLYASVYFFERGYCTRLNIPLDYIEISIPTISNDVMYFYLFILPIIIMTLGLMSAGKKHEFKGRYALSSPACGLLYSLFLFYFMEKSLSSAFASFCLGAFYFGLVEDISDYVFMPRKQKNFHQKIISIFIAAFLFSSTFVILGNSFAAGNSFDLYADDGKEYALLKVYGDNVFMQEIINGKRAQDITYFNSKDMTGMKLTARQTK